MTEAEKLVAQFKADALADKESKQFYTVAIYMEDRVFGGHEEGGWYYDDAQLVMEPRAAALLRGFDNQKDAFDYADTLNDTTIPEWNEGRPEISSVLSEGRYRALAIEGMPAAYYPEEPPRYE